MNKNSMLDCMYPLNLLGMNNNLPPQYQKVFETYAGSVGRGVSRRGSDVDVVAVFVPDYEQLFPYKVPGYGRQPERFKVKQVPDLSIRFRETGNITVDVLALDVVHLFNMLTKASPNHVEYLFFPENRYSNSDAGDVILRHKDLFLTQELVTKYVAAGCSITHKTQTPTPKELALACRFFSYATQVAERHTLDIESVAGINKRILRENDPIKAMNTALLFKDVAMAAEMKVSYLPPTVDEELVNVALSTVLNTHWEELSKNG